jgi:hypothetical protein
LGSTGRALCNRSAAGHQENLIAPANLVSESDDECAGSHTSQELALAPFPAFQPESAQEVPPTCSCNLRHRSCCKVDPACRGNARQGYTHPTRPHFCSDHGHAVPRSPL